MNEHYNIDAKKIEVDGVVYDSHLEYKYKVLFDQLGMKAIYHPVTFSTGKYWPNNEEICYTPDFYFCNANVYAEVKPRDEMLRNVTFQQKISAAMDHYATPIGHGLIILGDMTGFTPEQRQGAQQVCLWGDYYEWCAASIVKSRWILGAEVEGGEVQFFFDDEEVEFDDFPHYPRFFQNPSAELGRSYDDQRASKALWFALGAAMHAIINLEKNDDEKDNNEKGD